MTEKETIYYSCECGMDYEMTCYSKVDSKDRESRELLLSAEMFYHKCPYCGMEVCETYPVHYVNESEKFVVLAGDRGDAARLILQQKSEDPLTWEDGDDSWFFVASTTLRNEIMVILSLENNLDFHFVQIMFGYILFNLRKENNATKSYKRINDVYLSEDENGGLLIKVEAVDHDGEFRYFEKEFDYLLYKRISRRYSDAIRGAMEFCFDMDTAQKLLRTSKKDLEAHKSDMHQFLITEDREGRWDVAAVPYFNEDLYREGDHIITKTEDELFHVKVMKIFTMGLYECPWNVDSLPLAGFGHVTEPFDLKKDDGISNEELRALLQEYRDSGYKRGCMPTLELDSSMMYLAQLMEDPDPDAADEVVAKTTFLNYTDAGKSYLCVFLSKNVLPENLCRDINVCCYAFNDIKEIAMNIEGCDGIIINPESEKIIMTHERLLRYKSDRIMIVPERMKEYLSSLNEKEKEFLTPRAFNYISGVYFDEKTPKVIAEEEKTTMDDVGDVLDHGYSSIVRMIQLKKIKNGWKTTRFIRKRSVKYRCK